MALFGGIRDARFLAAINSELINAIIDTEIEFFKLIVESSDKKRVKMVKVVRKPNS